MNWPLLLTNDGSTLDEIPDGAVVGTTSMHAQLLRYGPRSQDGDRYVKVDETVPLEKCEEDAQRLAHLLVKRGGRELVEEAVERLSGI